jgi:hypothetical protein
MTALRRFEQPRHNGHAHDRLVRACLRVFIHSRTGRGRLIMRWTQSTTVAPQACRHRNAHTANLVSPNVRRYDAAAVDQRIHVVASIQVDHGWFSFSAADTPSLPNELPKRPRCLPLTSEHDLRLIIHVRILVSDLNGSESDLVRLQLFFMCTHLHCVGARSFIDANWVSSARGEMLARS